MSLHEAVKRLFTPSPDPGKVGVEIELIPVSGEQLPQPVNPARLAAAFSPGFLAAARPSFEPGGQLELSPAPRPSVAALLSDLPAIVARAKAIAASQGVMLIPAGTNPFHSCAAIPLRLPNARYREMQSRFDLSGPDGRRMMRLTASLQITVDLLPGAAGREQWLVANLAGPALTAAFANSPWLDGRPAGVPGARTLIWLGIDPVRTGYDGCHLDPRDPIGAYHAFAAAAPRFTLPEAADPRYHLNTLFPPVRPRSGYLEVRYLDAQPLERMDEAIRTVATLLYDQRARRDALDLLLPHAQDLASSWAMAASGVSQHRDDLLAIAAAGVPS